MTSNILTRIKLVDYKYPLPNELWEIIINFIAKDEWMWRITDVIIEYNLWRINLNVKNMKYIHNQTLEICRDVLQRNMWMLKYVKVQTEEICLTVVQHDGLMLKFVKEQTPDICLAAVKQNGHALQFVKKQTPDICTTLRK